MAANRSMKPGKLVRYGLKVVPVEFGIRKRTPRSLAVLDNAVEERHLVS